MYDDLIKKYEALLEREERSAKYHYHMAEESDEGGGYYSWTHFENCHSRIQFYEKVIEKLKNGEKPFGCEGCKFYHPEYVDELGVKGNYCELRHYFLYDTEDFIYCNKYEKKEK